LVRTHPQTGRLSLYASPRFTLRIDGISQERSDRLLAEIFALAEEPRFHYRHQWRDNDLVIWDNRCLNHRVRFFPTQDIRRRLRVSIVGDRPFYLPAASAHPDDVARADWCEARRRYSGRTQIDGRHDLIVAA
jgi:alpha-ketoglutarate-dependent taurine dioxygenase